MHVDLEPTTAWRSRPAWSTKRRVLVFVMMLFIAALAASSLNPVLAMGTNNRLESRCPTQPDTGTKAMEWRYERGSWTPFRWSCDITYSDGTAESYTPWRFWPQADAKRDGRTLRAQRTILTAEPAAFADTSVGAQLPQPTALASLVCAPDRRSSERDYVVPQMGR